MIVTAGFVWGGVRSVVIAVFIWACLRVFALLVYLARRDGLSGWSFDRRLLADQVRFSAPLGGAGFIRSFSDKSHHFIVSYLYDPALFAVYAVAYLQIPMVPIAWQSVSELTMIQVTQAYTANRLSEAGQLISDAVRKLSICLIPIYALLTIEAHDVIIALFTEKFAASVPIFQIVLVMVPLTAFNVEYVMRSLGATRIYLHLSWIGLLLGVALPFALAAPFGLPGVAAASIIVTLTNQIIMTRVVSRRLGVSVGQLLPWRVIGIVTVASGAAAVITMLAAADIHQHEWMRLGVATAVFGASYLVMLWYSSALEPDEKRWMLALATSAGR
jgi:O-antigen/teichoic acid export membrane protein